MRANRCGSGPSRVAALALAALALAIAAASCSTPVRRAHCHVGRNAQIEVDGSRIPVNPDGSTELRIPLRERNVIRIEEPNKAAIVEEVTTLIDPASADEDRTVASSTANLTIVYTGEKGGSFSGLAKPVPLFEDPIDWIRDHGGPYFNPPKGQGILLAVSDHGARAAVDGRERPAFEPGALATAEKPISRPLAIPLDPGVHTLVIRKVGLAPYAADVEVRPGEYTYVGVRLVPERRGGRE